MRHSRLGWVFCFLGVCAAAPSLGGQAAGRIVGNVLIPASSLEQPGDAGVRAHTHHRILLAPANGGGPGGGMTPAEVQAFYNMPGSGGHGTVAIVDAYHYPTALQDFNTFAQAFTPALATEPSGNALASGNAVFQVVYASTQPTVDPGWNQEAALDIEWAHALAPGAKIVLVEALGSDLGDLLAAVDVAAALPGVVAISMSWGSSEFPQEASFDGHFSLNGPVFVASAGDTGGTVQYPACSAYVLGAGGTSVATNSVGLRTGESAWSSGGGGGSAYIPRPAWQAGVAMAGSNRGTPDLSADADPNTGVSVYCAGSWLVFGGTSVAAPILAGMADVAGAGFASTTQLLTWLYGNALESPSPVRDITTGSNGHPALVGWDYATGVGVPAGVGAFEAPALVAAIASPAAGTTVVSGHALAFSGSATDTAAGATLQYGWAFGDGGTAPGAAASHLFVNPGTSSLVSVVTFTATDDFGLSASFNRAVTVAPDQVTASILAPAGTVTVAAGTPVAFTGSATDSLASASLAYAWTFGDGGTGAGASVSHTFGNPGTGTVSYLATLTVSDSAGVTATATRTVLVTPDLVTAAITSPGTLPAVPSGTTVAFAGTGTDSSASATLGYAWSFGDGGSATGPSVSHVFTNPASSAAAYRVTLTVTDSTQVAAQATMTIQVQGVSLAVPAASVGLLTGATATLTATVAGATDPSVQWTAPPGCTLTPVSTTGQAAFSAPAAGSYLVTAASVAAPAQTATITVDVHAADVTGTGAAGAVTGFDVLALAGAYGQPDATVDLNGDGTVDGLDLAILLKQLGW